MSVTLLVVQDDKLPLNNDAPENRAFMLVTLSVFHLLMSPLKEEALRNV